MSTSAPDVRIDTVVRAAGQFPVAARLGSVLMVVFRGRGSHVGADGRLDLIQTSDRGKTWSHRRTAVDTPLDDRNPAFGTVRTAGGLILVLAHTVLDSYDAAGTFQRSRARFISYVTRSFDGGFTWEPRQALNVAPFEWSSPYGKIVSVGNELVLPMYGGWLPVYDQANKPETRKGHFAFVLRSRDQGVTWGPPEIIAKGFAEPGLVALSSTELLAVLRRHLTDELVIARWTRLTDSWTLECAVTMTGEVPGDLTMLPNNELLLTYGERTRKPYGIRARRSRDFGRTWGEPFIVATVPTGEDLGYPSTVAYGDSIVTVYYAEFVHPKGVHRRSLYVARYRK